MITRLVAPALALGVLLPRLALAEGSGTVVVSGPPSAVVELDGQVKGAVDASGRLELAGVAAGEHRIVARRDGYQVQGGLLLVVPEREALWQLDQFVPQLPGAAEGTGALVLQTTGQAPGTTVTVDAPSLGWSKLEKSSLRPLLAGTLAHGRHALRVCAGADCTDVSVGIVSARYTSVRVDLATHKLEELAGDTNIRIARLRDECTGGQFASCAVLCSYETAVGPLIYGPGHGGERSACTLPTPVASARPLDAPSSECVAQVGKTAFLTLGTNRPAEVYLDGRLLGETPLSRAKVPAGCLKIHLVSTDRKFERTLELQTEPNQTAIFKASLD